MIDLRRLSAFVAVAEEASISRAADRLGMAQPPLSRLIQGLERELGAALLRRLPRGVVPTAAGRALLEQARAVIATASAIPDNVRRSARGETGRLAVGFTSSAALHPFVPAALRAFRAERPAVRLELEEAGTIELVAAMTDGRLDAAFVRSPVGQTPRLVVDPILQETMLIALPTGHALAGDDPLPLTALAPEDFVLYRRPSGPGLYDAIMTACRAAGFTPNVAQEAPRLPSTLSLVAAGLGITLVPASMRRVAIEGVTFRPLRAGSGLIAPLFLASRRDSQNPTVAELRTIVRTSGDSWALGHRTPGNPIEPSRTGPGRRP